MSASGQADSAREAVETIAGVRCPCGHLTAEHAKPDPDWEVGDFVEVVGPCSDPDCDCKGLIQ